MMKGFKVGGYQADETIISERYKALRITSTLVERKQRLLPAYLSRLEPLQ